MATGHNKGDDDDLAPDDSVDKDTLDLLKFSKKAVSILLSRQHQL